MQGIPTRVEHAVTDLEGIEVADLGRDLDLNLGPLFLFAFEDGGGVTREVLQLVDGRVAATTRDPGGGCGHL